MAGAAPVERPLHEDKIKRTAEFEADLSKKRDADKAETLVEDERPRIICVHTGYDRVLPKGSIRSARGISARINPGQKNGAFNKFEDLREAGAKAIPSVGAQAMRTLLADGRP